MPVNHGMSQRATTVTAVGIYGRATVDTLPAGHNPANSRIACRIELPSFVLLTAAVKSTINGNYCRRRRHQ